MVKKCATKAKVAPKMERQKGAAKRTQAKKDARTKK